MKKIFTCRRTVVALFSVVCLTFLGYTKAVDVAASIAAIAMGLSAANSFEGSKKKGKDDEQPKD